MATHVILYEPVIEFMRSWEGDIGRSVQGLCRRIMNFQKLYVPKKTGRTMASIQIGSLRRDALGLTTQVGANPGLGDFIGVAYWQEVGTRPHVIVPRSDNRRGYLVFFWARAGRVVYRRRVFHPGNRGVHWAVRGMESGMAAWG